MVNKQLMAYKSAEVGTASKLRLVIMMYDGAIRFLNETRKRIDAGDIAGRGLYISKAQRIIGELQESLNVPQGGEIAAQLEQLYAFIIQNLTKANIKGDKAAVDHALHVLENLRDAWRQVMQNAQSRPAETGAEQPRLAIHL